MENLINDYNEENIEKEFKNKIIEFIKYADDFNIYDILSKFYFDYKISYTDKNRNKKLLLSKKIMCLQALFCYRDNKKKKELEEEDFNKIDVFLEDIEKIVYSYESRHEEKELSEEEKEYQIHSKAFKDWSGKRYEIFQVQHHKDLLECIKSEFEYTYNFKLDELYNGIDKLMKNFYFVFEDSFNQLKKFIDDKKISFKDDGNIETKEKLSEETNKKIQEYTNNLFSLELTNVQKNTKWTSEFLEEFIISEREYNDFLNDITIENWNNLLNKIKYKPIVKMNGNYYILLQQRFYDNFDRKVIQGICNKFKENKRVQEIRAKYTSNIEKVVFNYFNNILMAKESYIGNYYDYNKKIKENDILIKLDNNIFIIEVKAGNFTPELASEDLESHKRALGNLIEYANKQQNELEECLEAKKVVSFYDGNDKKRRKKKFEIEVNDETNIFKIIVTAENFNDIEARADKIGMIRLSKDTLVFCLDDLRVYSEYFYNHPCYFIQYLLKRKMNIDNKNVDLCDELYHLGMWIEYNSYNEHTNSVIEQFRKENNIKEKLGFVLISGEDYMNELDAYYNNLYFQKNKVDKPVRNIPKEIRKIIDFSEKNIGTKEYTYLTTFLLNLNPETMLLVEKIILESKEFYKKNKRAKYRLYFITRKR